MTTEEFQQIISKVIKDCPGAYNMSEDIIIVGATQEEHEICLEKVVQKLNEHGLTLNATKCQINVPVANAPKDTYEVRSFLGSVNFVQKSKFCIHRKSFVGSN